MQAKTVQAKTVQAKTVQAEFDGSIMGTRWARVARGTLAALAAVFVSALFHVLAGGGTPGALAVALSLAFCVPACVALAGKKLSVLRLSISVVLSQFVFHALFSLSSPGPARFAAGEAGGHLHAGGHLIATGAAASAHVSMMPDSVGMWVGHACAALVTILAFRYGEAAFWGLLATAAVRIVGVAGTLADAPTGPDAPPTALINSQPVIVPRTLLMIGRMRHRGPPMLAPVCA
ncbi:hypothetical protein [Rathayibacter soli]|uniref:hypothetical protein n=1 Tax=Rathayibacter soli TaxID=3144168 RepID=UPI0027E3C8E2|nr:hypothetical protein [Glaciibacter superstes]